MIQRTSELSDGISMLCQQLYKAVKQHDTPHFKCVVEDDQWAGDHNDLHLLHRWMNACLSNPKTKVK